MKVKIRRDKLKGEVTVEYLKIPDKTLFRYNTLKNIFSEELSITIFIDTNQRKNDMENIDFIGLLNQSGIIYSIFSIEVNKTSFFGLTIDISRKKREEKLIALHIVPGQFTLELFKTCFENYDLGIGLGSKDAFNEVLKQRTLQMDDILFNGTYFEKSIYDSVLCALMRSSFNIESFLYLP